MTEGGDDSQDDATPERRTASLRTSSPTASTDPHPGARIGTVVANKYRIERVIGSGGMGVVVVATHVELGERVALKFLTTTTSEKAISRFRREAKIAIRLRSEHVARLMDIGALDNGEPFLVMEYLRGETLADRIRRTGPLPVEDAVDVVLQACEGVAEAHRLGIVHRDLKPSNLFLTERPDGSVLVKVLDFGIAKLLVDGDGSPADRDRPAATMRTLADGPTQTGSSAILGSLHYMSPEQLASSRDVDERTDVWALGVIMVETLTGALPFDGSGTSDVMRAIELEAPRYDLPDAAKPLGPVLSRCLAKAPAERPETVGALATLLVPFAAEGSKLSAERAVRVLQQRPDPIDAPPSPPSRPDTTGSAWGPDATQSTRRRSAIRRKRALSAVALVLAAGLMGAALWLRHRVRSTTDGAASGMAVASVVPPAIASDFDGLVGQWTGDFGNVTFGGNWGGYTDTFKTGPGMIELSKRGIDEFDGEWKESSLRHGTMRFTLSADRMRIDGTWHADANVAIGEEGSGELHFVRKGKVAAPGSATLFEASPELAEITGDWVGNQGQITVRGNWAGYTTVVVGPGLMHFEKIGERKYAGTWSDFDHSSGELEMELSADGRTIKGHKWPVPASDKQEDHPIQWYRR